MKLFAKNRDKITKEEEAQFSKLHFRTGVMWRTYYHFPEAIRKVIMVKEGDIILGWGITVKFIYDSLYAFHIFVHPDHRRKGIGTMIYKKAGKLYGQKNLEVSQHDRVSTGFYSNFYY